MCAFVPRAWTLRGPIYHPDRFPSIRGLLRCCPSRSVLRGEEFMPLFAIGSSRFCRQTGGPLLGIAGQNTHFARTLQEYGTRGEGGFLWKCLLLVGQQGHLPRLLQDIES